LLAVCKLCLGCEWQPEYETHCAQQNHHKETCYHIIKIVKFLFIIYNIHQLFNPNFLGLT
jgi:hypothetical protein